jgi:hypothetical protein
MSSSSKSWRDVLAVHPATDLLPMMNEPELLELGQDILKRGLLEGVALFDGKLLDGRNRSDAMEKVGIKLVPDGVFDRNVPQRNVKGCDPFAYVLSKNVHRRHLTAEQRREVIAKLLEAKPEQSNRQIAATVKVDHKTVASVRGEKVARGEIPHVATRTDTRGRKQAAHKPPPSSSKRAAADRAEARAEQNQQPALKPEPTEPLPVNSPPLAQIEADPSVEWLLDALIAMTRRNPRWINALPLHKTYTRAEMDNAINQLQLIAKTMTAWRSKKAKKAEALSITSNNKTSCVGPQSWLRCVAAQSCKRLITRRAIWSLDDGTPICNRTAIALIARADIVSSGDRLFDGVLAQTYLSPRPKYACGVAMIRCVNFRPHQKNTLRGIADLELARVGLMQHDCTRHRHANGKGWINFPARSYADPNAAVSWAPVIEFAAVAKKARQIAADRRDCS